jgi:very-short-patch-repair endonuclease
VIYDEVRTKWLSSRGYRVLRFPNADVFKNPQAILDAIAYILEEHGIPLPESAKGAFDPPSRGG